MYDSTTAGDVIRTVGARGFASVVLAAPGPIAVEFMSYSCAHCRAAESNLQQAARAVEARQLVCRVNVALDPELAAQYAVHATPTLVMFLHGVEVARLEGLPPDVAGLVQAMTLPIAA